MADDYGIKASAPGRQVTEASLTSAFSDLVFPPPDGTYFSSSWFIWKVQATGTFTQAIPSSLATERLDTVSVSHSLGYAPMVMMFFSVDGGANYFPTNADTEGSAAGTPLRTLLAQSTTANVSAEIMTINLAAYTLTVRYIIYADVGA